MTKWTPAVILNLVLKPLRSQDPGLTWSNVAFTPLLPLVLSHSIRTL